MSKNNNTLRYRANFGFTDLLFNLVVGFVFMFVLAFMLINPVAQNGVVTPRAEFMITASWPDDSPVDIDLWLRHSTAGTVSFSRQDNGMAHLARDDLGYVTDSIMDGHAEESQYINPINREVITVRDRTPGTYNINLHWYGGTDPNWAEIPITVEVIQIEPYKVIAVVEVTLAGRYAEGTALNFTVPSREVTAPTDINATQLQWVYEYLRVRTP